MEKITKKEFINKLSNAPTRFLYCGYKHDAPDDFDAEEVAQKIINKIESAPDYVDSIKPRTVVKIQSNALIFNDDSRLDTADSGSKFFRICGDYLVCITKYTCTDESTSYNILIYQTAGSGAK